MQNMQAVHNSTAYQIPQARFQWFISYDHQTDR
jgi:hypothetical protein